MVYELKDTSKAKALFAGMDDTCILSCLQKVMGTVYVTDADDPRSAFAYLGCFGFPAGAPDAGLLEAAPKGFSILVPQDRGWEKIIEKTFPAARRVTRYAIRKDTRFDRKALTRNLELLPPGYELKPIDGELYGKCLEKPFSRDFVSCFGSRDRFLADGMGMVTVKNKEIVSGASSYSRYREGIEIEVATAEPERRKHLALVCCSALILRCLEAGLYPSWDAANLASMGLAQKLGYEFLREYPAYEVLR
ncbi:MAG: GNAT family N-acetyltransferase [Abditibacteriota bacterium]|nr:GNAT family N-acetyltransferase [Abditibacteriota bacterium]